MDNIAQVGSLPAAANAAALPGVAGVGDLANLFEVPWVGEGGTETSFRAIAQQMLEAATGPGRQVAATSGLDSWPKGASSTRKGDHEDNDLPGTEVPAVVPVGIPSPNTFISASSGGQQAVAVATTPNAGQSADVTSLCNDADVSFPVAMPAAADGNSSDTGPVNKQLEASQAAGTVEALVSPDTASPEAFADSHSPTDATAASGAKTVGDQREGTEQHGLQIPAEHLQVKDVNPNDSRVVGRKKVEAAANVEVGTVANKTQDRADKTSPTGTAQETSPEHNRSALKLAVANDAVQIMGAAGAEQSQGEVPKNEKTSSATQDSGPVVVAPVASVPVVSPSEPQVSSLRKIQAPGATVQVATNRASQPVSSKTKAEQGFSGQQQAGEDKSPAPGTNLGQPVVAEATVVSENHPVNVAAGSTALPHSVNAHSQQGNGSETSETATAGPTGTPVVPQAPVNVAKLVQSVSQSELRVGMQSSEFGKIDIRTSLERHQFTAQISVEHSGVARVMAAELPALYERLSDQHLKMANVVVQHQSFSSGSGSEGQSPQPGNDSPKPMNNPAPEQQAAVVSTTAQATGRLDVHA